jgi:hypothetical protein
MPKTTLAEVSCSDLATHQRGEFMQLKTIVGGPALLGVASHALAQNAKQRFTTTGSRIKRVAAEGTLPAQTITRTEIKRSGIFSAEQFVTRISANLRGLGANSTLVLLNGRRVVAHGAKGHSAGLSFVPLAAVERVEVLKDSASAIYGADAIGGFNVMASLTHDPQQKLGGTERSFSNGFQPERGLSPGTTGTPFATQTGAAPWARAAPMPAKTKCLWAWCQGASTPTSSATSPTRCRAPIPASKTCSTPARVSPRTTWTLPPVPAGARVWPMHVADARGRCTRPGVRTASAVQVLLTWPLRRRCLS